MDFLSREEEEEKEEEGRRDEWNKVNRRQKENAAESDCVKFPQNSILRESNNLKSYKAQCRMLLCPDHDQPLERVSQ